MLQVQESPCPNNKFQRIRDQSYVNAKNKNEIVSNKKDGTPQGNK